MYLTHRSQCPYNSIQGLHCLPLPQFQPLSPNHIILTFYFSDHIFLIYSPSVTLASLLQKNLLPQGTCHSLCLKLSSSRYLSAGQFPQLLQVPVKYHHIKDVFPNSTTLTNFIFFLHIHILSNI